MSVMIVVSVSSTDKSQQEQVTARTSHSKNKSQQEQVTARTSHANIVEFTLLFLNSCFTFPDVRGRVWHVPAFDPSCAVCFDWSCFE